MPESNSPPPSHPSIVPDPAELQRRFDDDKWIKILKERAAVQQTLADARRGVAADEAAPLLKQNKNIKRSRFILLRIMQRNDAKIRRIREQTARQRSVVLLALNRRKIEGRMKIIKDRYIKQLICRHRESLNRTLSAKASDQ